MTAPSLYAAYGDKKRLFLEAAHRYAGHSVDQAAAIDDALSAFDAVRTMLIGAAAAFTGDDTPRGCLLASATRKRLGRLLRCPDRGSLTCAGL